MYSEFKAYHLFDNNTIKIRVTDLSKLEKRLSEVDLVVESDDSQGLDESLTYFAVASFGIFQKEGFSIQEINNIGTSELNSLKSLFNYGCSKVENNFGMGDSNLLSFFKSAFVVMRALDYEQKNGREPEYMNELLIFKNHIEQFHNGPVIETIN